MNQEVVILGSARTAIGTFGGSLKKVSPIELGTIATKAAIHRSRVHSDNIGQVVFGHVINTEPKDMYLSRVIAINSGIPEHSVAMNVNRLCGSGLQAVVSIIQSLILGDTEFGVAGGSEVMSQSPHILSTNRWGQKMGDSSVRDMMLGALNCPFGTGHMGITAENVASEYKITREEQDQFALTSQIRAAHALKSGFFDEQIITVGTKEKGALKEFTKDEHPKSSSIETLKSLPAVFQKGGTVTAGNASGLNDAAAAIVLGTRRSAKEAGLKPIARVIGYSHSGVRPDVMGIGPVTAVKKLLKTTGLKTNDFDVIESNEAFAAQACAVSKQLALDPEVVNPNGGAIALGHPIGATGVILVIKAIAELERTKTRKALITMCIGGGQGIALAIEKDDFI
jgi:acetyl-CoA C-acetyltransferase